MRKEIKTDQLGMYGDPTSSFIIQSNNPWTDITTKYLQNSVIATSADGTTKIIPPGTQNVSLPSKTVYEMQYKQMGSEVNSQQEQLMQLISAYCQIVSNGDESCAQKVAESLQKDPQKMVQQMTSTIQQAQQEQQNMQEEEELEDDGMRDGGCIDCQEQFPQAQNLNWFYKAQGGEAFPQANPYPHMYAMGGEAFPQAQTYLPYDRAGESRPNFMFQKGGTLYDYVKSLGLDPSYQSRKKLFSQYFDEPYRGTAEQNIYLLKALKEGNLISKASKPDGRKLPQTGVIVDKRSGNAIVLGSNSSYSVPVLTGQNVDDNVSLDWRNQKATPTGYYRLSDKNPKGGPLLNLNQFEGGYGKFMNPIAAYGEPAPLATDIAMHGTYLPEYEYRNQMYNEPGPMRNVSSGCVNCKKSDYQKIFSDVAAADTVLVLDTKKPKDRDLYVKAIMQSKNINDKAKRASQYSVAVTSLPGVTGRGYEYGGETDLESIYRVMKSGGFNMNAKKKKGKKESFEDYVKRAGGLTKFQGPDQSQAGDREGYESSEDYTDPFGYKPDMGAFQNPNWWQRTRLNIKNAFTPGRGASIRTRGDRPTATTQPGYFGDTQKGADEQDYDQTRGDGFPTVTLDRKGNIVNPNQQQTNQNQQQNKQQPMFGPGSKSDITVKQNQTMNPYAAYGAGRGLTNMFGSKFGALASIANAVGAGINSGGLLRGRSKMSYVDPVTGKRTRLKNSAADIAAAGMFGNMFPQQQATTTTASTQSAKTASPAQSYIDQQLPILKQLQRPKTQGGFRFFQPGGSFKYTYYDQGNNMGPAAFSAGVADQFEANRMEDLREQARNRSAVSNFAATTATKTVAGSPQGALNAPSFVPYTTESSFGQDAYLNRPMQMAQYGGDILDQFDDDQEVDLSEMTPQERDNFLKAVYAAGGSVEFL